MKYNLLSHIVISVSYNINNLKKELFFEKLQEFFKKNAIVTTLQRSLRSHRPHRLEISHKTINNRRLHKRDILEEVRYCPRQPCDIRRMRTCVFICVCCLRLRVRQLTFHKISLKKELESRRVFHVICSILLT